MSQAGRGKNKLVLRIDMKTFDLSEEWINYFLRIVNAVRDKSHCSRRKVGAVLVRDKRILATGYNGVPVKYPHCNICYGGERQSGYNLDKLPCVHAEINALCSVPDMVYRARVQLCLPL